MSRTALRWWVCVAAKMVSLPLAAQSIGLPLLYHPVIGGVGASLDVGGDRNGFRTVGFTGTAAVGHVTLDGAQYALFNVNATVAHLAGDPGTTGGSDLGANVSLLGSFAVGLDRSQWAGVTRLYVPLAAAIPLVGCASTKRILFLYAVPIWNFEGIENSTGTRWQPSWGAVNFGALVELQSGLGFQVGVGGLFQHTTLDPYRRVAVSAGVHFYPHGILKAASQSTEPSKPGCGFVL